jgi:hypothetical protein
MKDFKDKYLRARTIVYEIIRPIKFVVEDRRDYVFLSVANVEKIPIDILRQFLEEMKLNFSEQL